MPRTLRRTQPMSLLVTCNSVVCTRQFASTDFPHSILSNAGVHLQILSVKISNLQLLPTDGARACRKVLSVGRH